MKEYKSYMDRVNVSDEMHERLLGLEQGKKEGKPMKWKPYIAAAACAALLVGVGVWRVGARPNGERWRDLVATFDPYDEIESAQPSNPGQSSAAIEIAPVEGDGIEPGMKTIEGYETRETRAGVDVAVYHVLPWIDYGSANEAAALSLDWDIPEGAIRRELSRQEIIAFLGGADAVDLHLDWSDYELSGWGAWCVDGDENGDGPFWGAYLQGYKGPMDHFEFAVTAGQLPPTCVVFGGSVEQEVWGLTVTAGKHDGKDGVSRRVSFMKDDYGYRFDLTATGGPEEAEKLVSRAVTWIANGEGLNFSIALFHGVTFPASADVQGVDRGSESQPPSPPSQDEASAPSVPPAPAAGVSPDGASTPAWYPEGVEVLPPEEMPGYTD